MVKMMVVMVVMVVFCSLRGVVELHCGVARMTGSL